MEDWVGLTRLKGNFEEMKNDTTKPEAELKTMLVGRTRRKNYIAALCEDKNTKGPFFGSLKVPGRKGGGKKVAIGCEETLA